MDEYDVRVVPAWPFSRIKATNPANSCTNVRRRDGFAMATARRPRTFLPRLCRQGPGASSCRAASNSSRVQARFIGMAPFWLHQIGTFIQIAPITMHGQIQQTSAQQTMMDGDGSTPAKASCGEFSRGMGSRAQRNAVRAADWIITYILAAGFTIVIVMTLPGQAEGDGADGARGRMNGGVPRNILDTKQLFTKVAQCTSEGWACVRINSSKRQVRQEGRSWLPLSGVKGLEPKDQPFPTVPRMTTVAPGRKALPPAHLSALVRAMSSIRECFSDQGALEEIFGAKLIVPQPAEQGSPKLRRSYASGALRSKAPATCNAQQMGRS